MTEADYQAYRELTPYRAEPPAAPSAGVGKRGEVVLHFERDATGRTLLRHLGRRAPLIVQQALYFDRRLPEMACIYICSSGGPQVDGDRYKQHFRLGRDAMAHIASGAATKIASMRHNFASMHQLVELEKGAMLEYLPEPIIPCRRSRYLGLTELVVAPTASLFWSEIFLPGRMHHGGECFAYDLLSLTTTLKRPSGELLYREKQLLQPLTEPLDGLGIMNRYPIFANLIIVGPEAERFRPELRPFIDSERGLVFGALRLNGGAGWSCRLLGHTTEAVKGEVRRLLSRWREHVKGVPLPDEFPWR